MENNFNYETVPGNFAHCFIDNCARSNGCLRHLVAGYCSPKIRYVTAINPHILPDDTSTCSCFVTAEKKRTAWGIKNLLDKIPNKEAKEIKSAMMGHFGKSTYYRYYRKENGLTLKDQKFIRDLFAQQGLTAEPEYEYFTYEYVWE